MDGQLQNVTDQFSHQTFFFFIIECKLYMNNHWMIPNKSFNLHVCMDLKSNKLILQDKFNIGPDVTNILKLFLSEMCLFTSLFILHVVVREKLQYTKCFIINWKSDTM